MPDRSKGVVVWDPLLRLFHWSLLVFFTLAYWLEADPPELHSHAGYTVGLLVMFRLLWGCIGPQHARFSAFIPSMSELASYLGELRTGKRPPSQLTPTGHDPAGAVMIVALLVILSLTALSGILLFAMEGSGPLPTTMVASLHGGTLERIHGLLADSAVLLALLHVGGVVTMSVLKRENLIAAMISGKKYPHEKN